MNIICFINNLGSGGAQRQLVNLSVLFKENGHNVKFLVYNDDPFFEKKLVDNNIEIIKIIENNYLKRIFKIRKLFKKNWQDIVISFLETPNFIACFSAVGKHPWKLITNERSGTETSFLGLRNKIFKWFERFSDYTVCNSYAAKNMWIKYMPKVDKKISVIYNFIDIGELRGNYLPLKDGKYNIVVIASYQYIKNIINVINALIELDENTKNKLKIDWYGRIEVSKNDCRAYNEVVELINLNKLYNVIKLHNETNQVYDIMYNADFVGLFSKFEGLPNVICEALTIGKPIIMTPVSDYNILVDGNGILCDSCEIQDIKKALIKVTTLDKETILNMGRNSELIARKFFNKNEVYNKWYEIFIK